MKRILNVAWRILVGVLLTAVLVITVSGISPVYKFAPAKPFNGPDIFNPYAGVDSAAVWKRSLFHTHTRVKGPFNECEYWPGEVWNILQGFGYEIVTFSNHNRITDHPFDPELQVNVYEHGINLFKFHKLVFGSKRVLPFDNILPFFSFQRQFQLDLLGKKSDFIQLNHPFRTEFTTKRMMERLSGYQITELDSGITTAQEYWDWALSAGHYSFGLANDDLHYPDRSERIAVRCNFLDCPSGRYGDLKDCLLSGRYYSMRIPDYGNGDWDVKREKNRNVPRIVKIGLEGAEIGMTLSAPADSIVVTGSDHRTLAKAEGTASISYVLADDEPYARLTAFFPDGAVIYTNPFARYDSSISDSPFHDFENRINWFLTIIYNLLLILVAWGLVKLIRRL